MVSIRLGNRRKLLEHFRALYRAVENENDIQAEISCNNLYFELHRYFLGSNKKFPEGIERLFERLKYHILVSVGHYKRQILLGDLKNIVIALRPSAKTPKSKLSELHKEIRSYYYSVPSPGASNLIIDAFDEVAELQPLFEEEGGPANDFFPVLVQAMAECEPVLIQVNNIDRPSSVLRAKFIEKFGNLFSAMYKVMVPRRST